MPIDMKGYKVVYENSTYRCLQVEQIWSREEFPEHGEILYPDILRVIFIDHDAKIACVEDTAKSFAFLKEESK